MANTTRPSVPPSHASESEHRRQIANVVNIINQTTPDYSRTAAEISAGVTPVDYRYPEGDVRRYGAVGDGLTDDTEAVRQMHAVANEAGIPVSYSGVRRLLVQADARIKVNTDVDFAGCLFLLANGIKPDDEVGFDHFNTLFIIEDPATPEIRATVNVTESDNLKKGSMTPTKEWFSEPGFAYFQTAGDAPHLISSRDRQTTLAYRQSFRVFAGGQVNYPLSADVSFADTVWTRSRKMSARGFIELKNFQVDSSTYNNSILFLVLRNQVRFSNLDFSGVTTRFTINSLIRIECACDVYIENVVGSAQTRFQNPITGQFAGTYVLSMDTAAEVYLDRVGATGATSWGVMASSHVNGLHVTNCRLNRVDVHAGGHNIFVHKCTLDGIGAVFGWGGGIFSVVDSVAIDCPVLSSRVDYGGYWFGSLHVENVILWNRNFTATVVDLGSNPIGVSSVDVPAPESIVVRNVHRIRCSGETLSGIQPVYLLVDKSQTKKVFAPTTIEVSNVTGATDTRIYSTVDLANMEPSPVRARTQVYLRGLGATDQGADPTFYVPEGVVAGVGSVSLELHADANSWFSVSVEHLTNPRLYISDCWITAMRTSNTPGSRALLRIAGGEFREPLLAPGETHATIGGGYEDGLSYTSIANARVSSGFDLSQVSVLSGVVVSPGADVVLPAGVTPSDAFSGWRSVQFTS